MFIDVHSLRSQKTHPQAGLSSHPRCATHRGTIRRSAQEKTISWDMRRITGGTMPVNSRRRRRSAGRSRCNPMWLVAGKICMHPDGRWCRTPMFFILYIHIFLVELLLIKTYNATHITHDYFVYFTWLVSHEMPWKEVVGAHRPSF